MVLPWLAKPKWLNPNEAVKLSFFDNSASYKKKFKKEGQELEISYNGSFGKNTTSYNQLQYYTGNSRAFAGSNSLNPGKENEINFAIDYVQLIAKDVALETGFKTTLQSIISNADVFTLNATTNTFTKDNQQSYTSNYNRNIYAGYASANFSLFDYLEVKAGLRYEYTISKADYSTAHNVAIPNYSNAAPSIIVGHKFPDQQSVKLAYSYRIGQVYERV